VLAAIAMIAAQVIAGSVTSTAMIIAASSAAVPMHPAVPARAVGR
jgi:hypothetical protein